MARTTGPLFSLDASGTFAKTLTFSKWKGRSYVRERVIPANPKTAKQLGVRAMFKFLTQAWAALTAGAKSSWDTLAEASSIAPFNAFCAANMDRWQSVDGPSQNSAAAEASTPLTVTTMDLTGGAGVVTLEITPSGATNIWGIAIFRDTAEITVPSWINCVAVIPADGTNAVTHVDSPLDAATYHYRAAILNNDGVMGTVKADADAVVT